MSSADQKQQTWPTQAIPIVAGLLLVGGLVFAANKFLMDEGQGGATTSAPATAPRPTAPSPANQQVRKAVGDGSQPNATLARRNHKNYGGDRQVTLWWDTPPETTKESWEKTGPTSNVHPDDYAGAEACQKCHQQNYQHWSEHPHRFMNALATDDIVKGDFSGDATIEYKGGVANFYRENGEYRMKLERDGMRRVFQIHQTIGSRFFQYYIGAQLEGPERNLPDLYTVDHVLPFGYWLDREEWVPIVHVHDEDPDAVRFDPFESLKSYDNVYFYASSCNQCHTTFSLGDMLSRSPHQMARLVHNPLHLMLPDYLRMSHPEMMENVLDPIIVSNEQLSSMHTFMSNFDARTHAENLGVSCEACHLGCKEHVEDKSIKPTFFPRSPLLFAEKEIDYGRTTDNINWICGRCHAGDRDRLAAGMSTWNSTEASDAMRGSCYSQMKCTDCHDPHRATGPTWNRTPAQDDAVCLKCHEQLQPEAARFDHTHHPTGTEGARCLNCHMPRMNEGLQDVVRTHMIFSPTNASMIEKNHPNACNQCHTDQPIDWTLDHLKKWYGAEYSADKIAEAYPNRAQPVPLGWLQDEHESVRLLATDALTRTKAAWALPELAAALDDNYLLNRQFARIGLEGWLDIRLSDFGYRFYMQSDERREPVAKLRKEFERLSAELTGAKKAGGTNSVQE